MKRFYTTSIFYFFAAALWMMMIYYLSDTPNLQSGFSAVWDLILRKSAHAFVFFVLTFFWFKFFKSIGLEWVISLLIGSVISLIWAVLDEWHQSFVVGRNGSPVDVFFDGIGILFIWMLYSFKKFRQF